MICEECHVRTRDGAINGATLCPLHASAADLLAALVELLAVVETWNKDVRELDVERLWEAMRESSAAIRKAKGE